MELFHLDCRMSAGIHAGVAVNALFLPGDGLAVGHVDAILRANRDTISTAFTLLSFYNCGHSELLFE
jgi:hypothetical protein